MFDQGIGTLNLLYHTGRIYSQDGVMDYPRYPISELLHLVKSPDSLEFQSWKVNFKTEVCANSVFLQITVPWIQEVGIAKSVCDLLFNDEMLDAKIALALNKLLTSVHFGIRVSVEEQRAQKDDRFLRGRQIAYMIYEHFRATRASDLF